MQTRVALGLVGLALAACSPAETAVTPEPPLVQTVVVAPGTSDQRGQELPAFRFRYNWQRSHMGINRQTPISRIGLSEDNLLMLQIQPTS